jgi:hypothetical protein
MAIIGNIPYFQTNPIGCFWLSKFYRLLTNVQPSQHIALSCRFLKVSQNVSAPPLRCWPESFGFNLAISEAWIIQHLPVTMFAMFSNVSPSGQKKANYHRKGTKKNVCFPSFLFIIFSFPLIFPAFSLDVGQNQFGFHSDLISIYYTLNPVRVFAANSTSWRFNLKIWMYSKCALVIIHFKHGK